MSKLNRYFSTIRYMRPTQAVNRVLSRIRPKGKKEAEKVTKPVRDVSLAIPQLDCDQSFCNRFNPDGILKGEVLLLNKTFSPDYTSNARKVMKPLYRFNLYYFEYAVALGAEYKRTGNREYVQAFISLYEDYLKADVAMHPYVISLHIPNILIAMDLFADAIDAQFKKKIYDELYSQYKYLIRHFEKHLLANHYFENIKAAVIASYLFGEDSACKKYLKMLYGQVKEQILSDGVHFELSPMYHKIILEDLLRIAKLAENEDFPECEWLRPAIRKMLDAMASMEKGFGRTPLFNDSGDNVAKSAACLEKSCNDILEIVPEYKNCLSASGYYKLYDGDITVMIDAGKIGPDYNPGHGHCDCLSFELCLGGVPLFVNEGTYEYQGDMRKYFRSTPAHNTLTIGDHEQSECWGEHRVARRISNISAELNRNTFSGGYKNYLKEKHERVLTLENRSLKVLDSVSATRENTVHSYLHIADGFSMAEKDNIISVYDKHNNAVCSILPENCSFLIHRSDELCVYSTAFGESKQTECIEFQWKTDDKQHGYTVAFEI